MIFLVFIAALVVACSAGPMAPESRIVGGKDAVIEAYPYQISVQFWDYHKCGGAIISKHYVLTAGHCTDYPVSYYKIRAGSTFCNHSGSIHQVEEIIRHEDYFKNDYGVPRNDVALLKVKEPFQFDDTRQPISLYNSDEESVPGVNAVITGYGRTSSGGPLAPQLQYVTIPIISKELCNNVYTFWEGLPEGQICAGDYGVGGKDSCQSDSGGPLAINGRLAGVISWGNGCAQPYYPGVYTEVAHYRDWINKHAQE